MPSALDPVAQRSERVVQRSERGRAGLSSRSGRPRVRRFVRVNGLISVTARPHWVSGWLLRPLARPVVVIDGAEHAARWGTAVTVAVPAGRHTVGVGMRYRGFTSLLGVCPVHLNTELGHEVRLRARNGLFNGEPFYVTVAR